MNSIS